MVDVLAALPPALLFLATAASVAALPRRAGAAVGVAVPALATVWLAAVPAGTHLPARLFGFPVVLFHVDPLSRTVGLVVAFLASAAVAYGYDTGATRRGTALSLAYLGAGLGVAFAGDWLTLVVWWEVLAVTATALVWTTGDAAATRAGLRYAVYHEVGGLALLAAVLVHYAGTGSLALAGGLAGGAAAPLATFGVGLNVAVVGLHPWLVDAYPRPHVATSVVLVAGTTKVGVATLARAFPDGSVGLAYLGGATLLVGVTYAILQTDVRRLLSYHVVSQVGIMVAGVGVGSPLGVAGAAAHLVNNVLYKCLLFMVAGLLVVRTGRSNLKRLGGPGRAMPVAVGAFLVAAPAIAGVPGFNGFVSKGMVFDAVQDAGLDPLWWMLLVGSVGTVVSFAKFGYYAFVRGVNVEGRGGANEAGVADTDGSFAAAGPAATAALAALAVPCVVFGVAPGLQFAVLPGATAAAKPFSPSQFAKAGAVLAAGGVAFLVLRAPLGRVSGAPDLDAVYHPLGSWLLRVATRVVGDGGARVDAAAGRIRTAVGRVAVGSGGGGGGERSPERGSARESRAGVLGSGLSREDPFGWSLLLVVATLVVLLVVLFL